MFANATSFNWPDAVGFSIACLSGAIAFAAYMKWGPKD